MQSHEGSSALTMDSKYPPVVCVLVSGPRVCGGGVSVCAHVYGVCVPVCVCTRVCGVCVCACVSVCIHVFVGVSVLHVFVGVSVCECVHMFVGWAGVCCADLFSRAPRPVWVVNGPTVNPKGREGKPSLS